MALVLVISLTLSAISVSIVGASFSITGLARLFSGASLAVTWMAISLEFSKFAVTAFLHRSWRWLNPIYRSYLFGSVVVLSVVTSIGIFGFLSDAYQTSSLDLASEEVKLTAIKDKQTRNATELASIQQRIDAIPNTYVTRRLKTWKEAQASLQTLNANSERYAEEIKQLNLRMIQMKSKVGPLIYIARILNLDLDIVVKWLVFFLVTVFDPLAICLVIATSEALRLKAQGRLSSGEPPLRAPAPFSRSPASSPDTSLTASNDPEKFQMRFAPEQLNPQTDPTPPR